MITIRKINSNEIRMVQDLNYEIFKDNFKYDDDFEKEWTYSSIGSDYYHNLLFDPKSICLVAEENKKPIGYIAGRVKNIGYRKSKYFETEIIGVNENFQRKGIGRKLLAEFEKIAKKKGFNKLIVNTYIKNTSASDFYKSCGFDPIDISFEKKL